MKLLRYQPLLLLGLLMLGVALVLGSRGGSGAAAQPPMQVGPTGRVFVAFDGMPGPAQLNLIQRAGGTVVHNYSGFIPYVSVRAPEAAVPGLRKLPGVRSVEPVPLAHAIAIDSTDAEYDWGVDRIDAEKLHGSNRGAGIKVAIIDSGVRSNHGDLTPRVVHSQSFVSGVTSTADNCNHGTHVAGIVGASKNGSGTAGVAPEVHLYNLKVLELSGFSIFRSCSGGYDGIIAAIQWAAANDIDVINMSFGGSAGTDALAEAVTAAYEAGVVMIAAAGNGGSGTNTVGYPARYPEVIAVAATDSSDNRASFSSTGPDVELSAPGVSIRSTTNNGSYATFSGTSMASPHVAGLAALIIKAHPGITNVDVRERMRSTAIDLGAAGKDNLYGYGLVMAPAAVNAVVEPANTPTPTNTATITPTASNTSTPTSTATPSNTPTPTSTATPSNTPTPTNTPANTSTPTNTATATNTPPPTATPSAVAIHVGDIDATAARSLFSWRATVTVTIHDSSHAVVSGALVSGSFTNSGGSFSCTTGATGQCSMTSNTISAFFNASMTFTVTNVSKSGTVYNSAANHDPDGDSNGTSIVIARP